MMSQQFTKGKKTSMHCSIFI